MGEWAGKQKFRTKIICCYSWKESRPISTLCRWENCSAERLSSLPKVMELLSVGAGARITSSILELVSTVKASGLHTSMWRKRVARVGRKTLWCPKWLKTSFTKWILLAWLGALPWEVCFCLTSSTQTQSGSKGIQCLGCLEDLGRCREASLKLRPRQLHIHPGWRGFSAQSHLVPGCGFQAVVDQLIAIPIFNNTEQPNNCTSTHSSPGVNPAHVHFRWNALTEKHSAYRFPKR